MFQPQPAVCGCEISAGKYTHPGSVCTLDAHVYIQSRTEMTVHGNGPHGDVMLLCIDAYNVWQWREEKGERIHLQSVSWLCIASSVSCLLKKSTCTKHVCHPSIHFLYCFLLHSGLLEVVGASPRCHHPRHVATVSQGNTFYLNMIILDRLLFSKRTSVHTAPLAGLVKDYITASCLPSTSNENTPVYSEGLIVTQCYIRPAGGAMSVVGQSGYLLQVN